VRRAFEARHEEALEWDIGHGACQFPTPDAVASQAREILLGVVESSLCS
jgi:hypothetical protein